MSNPDEELPFLLTTATATATATATTASAPVIFGTEDNNSPPRRKLRIGPTLGGISKTRVSKKLNPSNSSGSGGGVNNVACCICSECGKRFGSWKALFGHMRCHPERQWRGMIPPPNFRPVMIQASTSDPSWLTMTEEDFEVAECLLMLANSGPPMTTTQDPPGHMEEEEEIHQPQHVDDAGRFECSSCKKVFGSHQALGGHRASHKNVKGCFALMTSIDTDQFRDYCGEQDKSTSPSIIRPPTNSSSADTDLDLDLRLGL